jgi:hypothetical protein
MDAVTSAATRVVPDVDAHAICVSKIIISLTWIGTKDFSPGDEAETRRNKGVLQFAACHHVDRGLVPFESTIHEIVGAFNRLERTKTLGNEGDVWYIISAPLELCLKFEVALAGVIAQSMTADFFFP